MKKYPHLDKYLKLCQEENDSFYKSSTILDEMDEVWHQMSDLEIKAINSGMDPYKYLEQAEKTPLLKHLESTKELVKFEFNRAGTPTEKMYEKGRLDMISEIESWITKGKT